MGVRPNWDELWMAQAILYAARSVCLYYKVGAVFVRDNVPLAGGYNGPPKKEVHCTEVGCARKVAGEVKAGAGLCRGCHAEPNAICNAADNGINIHGSVVYCVFSPCYSCAKQLAQIRINEFIYLEEYSQELEKVRDLFGRLGIGLRQLSKTAFILALMKTIESQGLVAIRPGKKRPMKLVRS